MTEQANHTWVTQSPSVLIWKNTLPMIAAILALFSYDLLESTLIALQDESVLTSFGFTLPLTAAMTALAVGLSIRSNNKVIQKNCSDPAQVPHEIINSLLITVIIVGCFSLLFFSLNEYLLSLIGNVQWSNDVSNDALTNSQHTYLSWRYLGWIFMALIWQSNAILRALGWMKSASMLMFSWMTVKSVLLIIFLMPQSPFFQENFAHLGLIHLVSDITFAIFSIVTLYKKSNLTWLTFKLKLSTLIHQKRHGNLVVIQQFITPISMAIITAIAAEIDSSYVAALALLFRLEVLILLLPMVLTTSVPTIVGANYWLGHSQRVSECYWTTFGLLIIAQTVIALIAYSQSYFLSSLVCSHDGVSSHLQHYLQWAPWGYAGAAVTILFQSCLNAKNLTVHATLIAIIHRLLLVAPFAAIGLTFFGEIGFYQGLMIGHLCAIIPVLYLLKRFGFLKYKKTSLEDNHCNDRSHDTKITVK